MTKTQFQINQLQEQRSVMIEAIKFGNWEGYSENLIVRKQQLRQINIDIKQLENE